ncbi:SpoIVB peptidase [Bacillus cytotoxicus]
MNKLRLEHFRKIIGICLLVSLVFIVCFKPLRTFISFPKQLVIFEGEQSEIESLPVFQASSTNHNVFTVSSKQKAPGIMVNSHQNGEADMVFQLAGFPVKKVNVKVLKDFKSYSRWTIYRCEAEYERCPCCWTSFNSNGKGKVSPGELAGVQVGDMITAINGKTIERMSDVAPFIHSSGETGEPLHLVLLRDGKHIRTKLTPQKDSGESSYRIGLYIRDSATGIGTMTFIDPNSMKYGALGHVISDNDTKKPIQVEDGQIMRSTVTSIERGSHGNPGEKLAKFSPDHEVIGNITTNSPFGIFGKLNTNVKNGIMDKAMPIALSHQVKEGPAKILTVIDNDKVESFDVDIVSAVPQKFPATKGMVIKVTDKRLLEKTGGIVQGMSGSPIVQNGKVIGAVTHVFVNDPTSGYGVHIEWMLHEAGINIYEQNKKAS